MRALEEKVISEEIAKPKPSPKGEHYNDTHDTMDHMIKHLVYANMDREQQDQSSTDSLFGM